MSTTALDLQWIGRPKAIASALLEFNGKHALVDPGPESTVETLRQQLSARGLGVKDLEAVFVTHIHLDHAGATGSLVRENPRLAVYVHKLGGPHMIDPSKLLASAGRLWGDDLQWLFGNTLPVPQENLRILEGGESLTLGGRKLDVVYTPGHASHHVSYFDDEEGTAFVGDTTGICIENQAYIMPATPPPDIDLTIWDASFAAILGRHPARLFLTHFGVAENPAEHIAQFRERLHLWARIAEDVIRGATSESGAVESFVAAAKAEIAQHLPESGVQQYAFTAGIDLSFLGLARYLRKRAEKAAEKTAT
jgi:glyoxylase-like metal-dependent hydrolase (beta-lactamase superfamily II)